MEKDKVEKSAVLLGIDTTANSFNIKRAYSKKSKSLQASKDFSDFKNLILLKEAKITMLEHRSIVKAQNKIDKENAIRYQIQEKIRGKKFWAPKIWYSASLFIICWAILQEVVMASTDIVDNVFVNWMKEIPGLDDLRHLISYSQWDNITLKQLKDAHLSTEYFKALDYNAGQLAVNGVTASNQLYTIMYCVVSGACYGIGVYSAQYYGAGNTEKLRQIVCLKFYFTVSVTVLFSLFALPGITEKLIAFTTHPIPTDKPNFQLNDMSTSEQVRQWFDFIQYRAAKISTHEGALYFRTIAWSYILLAINESIITSLRETRRPVHSFVMSIVALITNCILNVFLTAPSFIPGFTGLGIQGCALATGISRVFQLVVILSIIIYKKFEFFPTFKSFAIRPRFAFFILLRTSPVIVNELLYAFGQVLIVKLRGMYSVEVLTANAMASTVVMAVLSPLYHGLNAGISVFVGNELGANRFDIAKYNAKHLIRMSVFIGVIFAAIVDSLAFVIPDTLFSNSNDAAKNYASWMLIVYGTIYPFIIMANGCYSILRTGGSMWGAFSMDSGLTWTIQIPLLATLILLYTHGVLYLDYTLINLIVNSFYIIQFFIAIFIYSLKRWVRNVTEKANENDLGQLTVKESKIAKQVSTKREKRLSRNEKQEIKHD